MALPCSTLLIDIQDIVAFRSRPFENYQKRIKQRQTLVYNGVENLRQSKARAFYLSCTSP